MKQNYDVFYQNMAGWFRKKESRRKGVVYANRFLTYLFYVAYPLLLIWIFLNERSFFLKALLVPAVTFVVLSLVRTKINRKRPYEQWQIDPLIHKDTRGKSMPSRHLFSSAVISMVFLHVSFPLGTVALILSILDGILRVVGGVHYPSDVCTGFVCGCLAGLLLWL